MLQIQIMTPVKPQMEQVEELVQNGNLEELLEILKKHAELVNKCNYDGRTVLQLTIQYGQIKLTKALLEQQFPFDFDHGDHAGWTALHQAASIGLPTGPFIERGANINARSNNGTTALHHAASKGHRETVEELLEYGAMIMVDKRGATPLHRAAAVGRGDIVELLVEHDPSIVNKQDDEGNTALYHTSSCTGY